MSMTQTIENRIRSYRDQALAAKNTYSEQVATIDADMKLSNQWKREQKQTAYAELARSLEKLQGEEKSYIETTIRNLERDVYGIKPGQDILAYRDAKDRVSALHYTDEAAALELYRQAERSDDTTLQQALSERAVDAGWSEVQARHIANHPAAGDSIEALGAIQAFNASYSPIGAFDYVMPAR